MHIRTTPTIDRLVRISDHADILETRCQELNQLVLGMVGILILVDMDVLEFLLVIGQDLWILVKKAERQHDQIIKVNGL